jgi:SET domain-containing protein
MINPSLYINDTLNKGRGVYTRESIPAETIIEDSPVIVMTNEERVLLDQTLLHDYIFEWGPEKKNCCMALGYIAVYNHSYTSNCEYFMDFELETIQVKTVRAIEAGEELTFNYNGTWDDGKGVWFDVQ